MSGSARLGVSQTQPATFSGTTNTTWSAAADMWLRESNTDCVSNCRHGSNGGTAVVPTYRYLHGDSLPCPPPNTGKDCGNSLAPLFKMGHGLSYTTWDIQHGSNSHVMSTTSQIAAQLEPYFQTRGAATATPAQWTITVTNTGDVASGLTVLCFVSSNHTDAPIQKLAAFERLPVIAAGASANVTLYAATTSLSLTDKDGTEAIIPGEYAFSIGLGNSGLPLSASLSLSGENVTLWSLKSVRQEHEAQHTVSQ